jgi:hypothetical protein
MPKGVYQQIQKVVIQENEKEIAERNANELKGKERKKPDEVGTEKPVSSPKVPSLNVDSVHHPIEKSVSSPRLKVKESEPLETEVVSSGKGEKKEKEKEKTPLREKDIGEIISQSSMWYRFGLFFFTCCYLSK